MATRCGACKLIRRKCKDDCVFAPFFPSDQIDKFSCLHSVFGSRYVSKCLTKLPFNQREAEVNSLVFQAKARREDPVHGSAGLISRQQQQLVQLQQEVDFLMKRLQPPQLQQMQLQQPQLPQMQLQPLQLPQMQLQQAQLPQTQLQQPHLPQTQLQQPQTQLQQPHFPQTQLQQPHFPQTQLQQLQLPQMQLQPLQLPQMQLQQPQLPQTQLQQPHLPQTQLQQPHFPQTQLQQLQLPQMQLQQPHLPQMQLQQPQLPQMQLQQPHLPQTQLQQPHFPQTQLQQLHLPQTQLQQPHFPQTQLQQPHFPQTQLQQPHFPQTQLQQLHFPQTQLQQLQLPQTQFQQLHFPQTQLQQPHFLQTQLQPPHFLQTQFQPPHFPQTQLQPQLPQMQLQQLHFPQTQLQHQHFPQTQLQQPHFPQRKRKTSMSTRAAKKKKKATPNTSDEVLSLPYDLLVMIVARVPILYYRTLSLVSKSFQSMVASTELYRVRSVLGLTESCLYVCMSFGYSSRKWYTLSSKSKSSSSGSSGYVLGRVSIIPPGDDDDSPPPRAVGSGYSDLVAVGSDIYNIGQAADKTGVSILDCKTHKWRKAPSMPVEVESISARVLDQKIYVLGRRYHNQDGSWKSLLQVFNTNTQTWDDIPWCVLDLAIHTFNIDGNLHAIDIFGKVFAFNSKQGRWDLVEQYPRVCESMFSGSYCEIDNVLYSVSKDGVLRWYDTDKTRWRDLKGLVGLPKLPSYGAYVKLTGYGGGKMMLFWNGNFNIHLSHEETIYCAEIALERRNGDCWGKLEWYDGVHSVLAGTEIVKVLSVTL